MGKQSNRKQHPYYKRLPADLRRRLEQPGGTTANVARQADVILRGASIIVEHEYFGELDEFDRALMAEDCEIELTYPIIYKIRGKLISISHARSGSTAPKPSRPGELKDGPYAAPKPRRRKSQTRTQIRARGRAAAVPQGGKKRDHKSKADRRAARNTIAA